MKLVWVFKAGELGGRWFWDRKYRLRDLMCVECGIECNCMFCFVPRY